MPNTSPSSNPVPYYLRPAERKTDLANFRIYQDQKLELAASYDGNASLLIRLLLDAFFKGNLPSVTKEYEQLKKT